jgi:hypothetical protein
MEDKSRKLAEEKARARSFSYDDEPTEFHEHDETVRVTALRENDKFKHRTQGWVVVRYAEPAVSRVKITYRVEGVDQDKTTYADMTQHNGDPMVVPVVRRDETDEHKLWRLEHELVDAVFARYDKATKRKKANDVEAGRSVEERGLLSYRTPTDYWKVRALHYLLTATLEDLAYEPRYRSQKTEPADLCARVKHKHDDAVIEELRGDRWTRGDHEDANASLTHAVRRMLGWDTSEWGSWSPKPARS